MTADRHWTTVVVEGNQVAVECSCGERVIVRGRSARDRRIASAHRIARFHRENPDEKIA